jgi:CRP-like cAMP-binding protein
MPETKAPENRILASLTTTNYQQLIPKLKRFDLIFGENIYKLNEVISHVYFPEIGIISLLSAVGERSTLEVGIIGNEGMVGVAVFLGVKTSGNVAVVQGKGSALRMTAEDFVDACKTNSELPAILQRFTHSLMTQISQSAVCYRFHLIEERLARWLLMTADRMQSDKFQITQDFLSNMLGVRREAVNKSATILQQQQLIRYSRGSLEIIDRKGLESATCVCYSIIKAEENSVSGN